MHAIHGGCVGQTFSLATSNDKWGKKSRMRRSKEERKTMTESFIKKYQKSNNGSFPSLNLTHKEVGGSFYTVREIVREIIQENRVLAPPKKYLDKHDPSGFMEQHTLGSSPMGHQNYLSASDNFHITTPILAQPTTNGELISCSSLQFSDQELNDEQVFSGQSKLIKIGQVCEEASISHLVPSQFLDTRTEEVSNSGKQDGFENEKMSSESEGLKENTDSDKELMTNNVPIDQDNSESTLQCSQNIHDSPVTQERSDDHYLNKNGQMVGDLNGTEKQAYTEPVDMEICSKENVGSQDKEVSQVAKSNTISVAEIFPVTPPSRRVLGLDGKSGDVHEAAEGSEDVANKSEKTASIQSNSDADYAKDEKKLKEKTLILNHKFKDEKVVQNLHEPISEDSKLSTTASPSELNNSDVNEHGSNSSLLDKTKISSSSTKFVYKAPARVGIESNSQNWNGLKKMDRINLKTWKGAQKKRSRPESNLVLALVKGFLSVLAKLWT